MKRLIFRLSSMGDIILSQSALEVPFSGTTDWVTSKEFESLFSHHPKLNRVWFFSRKTEGLTDWFKLILQLYQEHYDEVIDLHSSHRTRLAHRVFFFISLYQGKPMPRWRSYRKNRMRRLGYITFKNLWPKRWRPIQFTEACAKLVGGTGLERPNFRHLLKPNLNLEPNIESIGSETHYAVMPASNWKGKEWGVNHFFEFIEMCSAQSQSSRPAWVPVILGTEHDHASLKLIELLKAKQLTHLSFVGKLDLVQTAQLFSKTRFLISNDTGLSHLAEAVGTPVYAIYGPTTPDFGFSVSSPKSEALHSGLWCAPCSKDGSLCFRVLDRYACMKNFDSKRVYTRVMDHKKDSK